MDALPYDDLFEDCQEQSHGIRVPTIIQCKLNQCIQRLQILKLLFSIYKRIDKTIDTSEIQKEISSRVREELDYSLEQKHMELFSFIFDKNKKIHIPYVLNKISTKRLHSMNYLEGKKLLEFKKESEDSRKELAKNMFHAWYYPFYKYGVIHGDPHLGNYSANNKYEINLLCSKH